MLVNHGIDLQIEALEKPLKLTAMCHETVRLGPRAQMASSIIQLVLASNREKVLPNKRVLIDYACELAEMAYAEFTQRGWAVASPPIEELKGGDDDKVGF